MKPRLIDANALYQEFSDRALKARQWKEGAILNGNEEAAIRADAVLAFLTEVKLTIDNAPTLNDKAYTIGYAAGSREGYKKGIEEARPTGEWIDTGDLQEYWAEEYQCSLCGAKDHWHNYCPNCGAKMKQEEEDVV